MLTESILNSATPLADKYATRNIRLLAIESTPLHELCNVSGPVAAVGCTPTVETILELANNVSPMNQHDLIGTECAATCANTVAYTLNLARNVVNPIITRVLESVEASMNVPTDVSSTRIAIRLVQYPPLYKNRAFIAEVDRFFDVGMQQFKVMPILKPDNWLELLKTGNGTLDREIRKWVDTIPEATLETYWGILFQLPMAKVNFEASDPSKVINAYSDDLAAPLFVYLWCRNLIDNPPDNTGMSLAEYNEILTHNSVQCGRIIGAILKKRELEEEQKQVILSYPMQKNICRELATIRVDAEGWAAFLADGGEPEIAFGAWLTDRPTTVDALKAKAVEYLEAWRHEEALLVTMESKQRFSNSVLAIREAITAEVQRLNPEDKVVESINYSVLIDKLLLTLPSNWYENAGEWITTIVCKGMFPHTDVLTYLKKLNECMAKNSKLSAKEAAWLAMVEYVTLWTASLIRPIDSVSGKQLG